MLQVIRVNQPVSAKADLEVTAAGWFRITEWIEKSKDGYGILLQLARPAKPKSILVSANSSIDETTPRDRWTPADATITVPADGQDYLIYVKVFPPAGTIRWTRLGLWPNDQLAFFDVDQATIVRDLVEHAQDPAMGRASLGLETRTPLTGVPRTRQYPYRDHTVIAQAIDELSALYRGVDTSLLVTPTRRIFRTHYSRQGSTSDLVLAVGANLLWLDAPGDLTQTATAVIAQADSIGAHREETYARNPKGLGGMVLEEVISAEKETPINELDEVAVQGVARRAKPVIHYTAAVHPTHTDDVLKRLQRGDLVRVIDDRRGIDVTVRYVAGRHNHTVDALTLSLTEEV
jgi:hypothetical protein